MTLDTQMTLVLLPELSADYFDGLSAHSDAVTGGGGKKAKGTAKIRLLLTGKH